MRQNHEICAKHNLLAVLISTTDSLCCELGFLCPSKRLPRTLLGMVRKRLCGTYYLYLLAQSSLNFGLFFMIDLPAHVSL